MNFANNILFQIILIQLIFSFVTKISIIATPIITYEHQNDHDQIAEESQIGYDQTAGLLNSAVDLKLNLLTPPVKSRESAKLETEQLPSRILSVYDDKQYQSVNNRDIKPIIDTTNEQDKYGNNGDKFYGIGRMLVNGYEAFANFLNRVLDKPSEIAKSISKKITEQLNIVGGKLVGLD